MSDKCDLFARQLCSVYEEGGEADLASIVKSTAEFMVEASREFQRLEEHRQAIIHNPDVERLYFGAYHHEPCARSLIEEVVEMTERELSSAVGVESFFGYEGDGGLKDGIGFNIHAILLKAGVLDEDHNVSRHKPQHKRNP